ncbi:MAG: ribosome maturation factor RimP, partial [Deltaproteobacteria bacterium]|nr:ribosome maturation factor RimP [Deltaproteobacteria bacterium]
MSERVIEKVREFAVSLLPSMGLELYDVHFRREGHGWVLRLVIDSPKGVTLDDCSLVSRETSDFLDIEDFVEHAYSLEVSSPGIERTLKDIGECERFTEKKVRVKLSGEQGGQRVFIGDLCGTADNAVTIR